MAPLTLDRYARLTAADMVDGLRQGAWWSRDLVEAAAALIAAVEPGINAHVTLTLDQARETASSLMPKHGAGKSRGALHGLPVSIKDTYDIPGIRSTRGSKLYADQIASQWSPLAQRVLDGRRRHDRQDHHAGVRLEGVQHLAAHRRHPQSVGHKPDHRRLQFRLGGRGGGADNAGGAWR